MELQNGGEEIRQEKWRKKVEKWWRNDEEMQWRKVKWGRRRPRHKAIYPPPFTGRIRPVKLARGVYGLYTACKPGQKALRAV